jgi:hypothetical protein
MDVALSWRPTRVSDPETSRSESENTNLRPHYSQQAIENMIMVYELRVFEICILTTRDSDHEFSPKEISPKTDKL